MYCIYSSQITPISIDVYIAISPYRLSHTLSALLTTEEGEDDCSDATPENEEEMKGPPPKRTWQWRFVLRYIGIVSCEMHPEWSAEASGF
jgi:hypothetical protein